MGPSGACGWHAHTPKHVHGEPLVQPPMTSHGPNVDGMCVSKHKFPEQTPPVMSVDAHNSVVALIGHTPQPAGVGAGVIGAVVVDVDVDVDVDDVEDVDVDVDVVGVGVGAGVAHAVAQSRKKVTLPSVPSL